ncbi:MAG: hypothetical protein LRY69_05395 [Gammaproteobacteria bacterium]|nr:hypothetical protein [Gammaproteobacteria bacterium]
MKNTYKSMQEQQKDSYLDSANAEYLASLENDPLADRHHAIIHDLLTLKDHYFHHNHDVSPEDFKAGIHDLIDAFRRYGHRLASLDPLNLALPVGHPTLSLEYFGLQGDAEAKIVFEQYKKNLLASHWV